MISLGVTARDENLRVLASGLVPANPGDRGFQYPQSPHRLIDHLRMRIPTLRACGYYGPDAGTSNKIDISSTRNIDLSSLLVNVLLRVLAGTSGYWQGPPRIETREKGAHDALSRIGAGNRVPVPASTRKSHRVTLGRSPDGAA